MIRFTPATLIFAFVIALASCAPRANVELVSQEPGVGTEVPVLLGTSRAEIAPGEFSEMERGDLSFARYVVSIPPTHEPGLVEVAGRTPDPERDFVTRNVQPFDAAGYRRALSSEMERAGVREAVLFVHGFNNTLADGLYRLVQMKVDLELPGVPVHYSWPSAGNPLGYVRDRDSALFGREGLIDLLNETARAGAERIVLVAHSMGAFMTMETLVWMQQTAPHPGLDALAGVVFLSPDIDVELFRAQATQFGDLPQPFFIFTSSRDRALALSARLTRETDRLGSIRSIERVADLDVELIDVTNVTDSASRHLAAVSSPTMIGLLRRAASVDAAFEADPSARIGVLPGTVVSVQNATGVIVSPTLAN